MIFTVPYLAAVSAGALLLCAISIVLCACKRRRRKDKEFKARLDGALQPEERPYDRAKTNGVPVQEPPRQYATVQKYATIDKYSLSQKYCAGLNDARYYDEVAQRDKLADPRYASLGRAGRGVRVDNSRGNTSRRPMPEHGYPDLKDGFC